MSGSSFPHSELSVINLGFHLCDWAPWKINWYLRNSTRSQLKTIIIYLETEIQTIRQINAKHCQGITL